MREINLKCDICGKFFQHDVKEKNIIGIYFGAHDELVLDYSEPHKRDTHICDNCLYQLKKSKHKI